MATTLNYKAKVISKEYADELTKDGYYAIDPHCHSSYSFDVPDAKETSPESVIKVQKSKGLRFLLSDHDTLNGYANLRKKGYKVVPAVELTFKPKIVKKVIFNKPIQTFHINIFGLNNHDLVMLKEIAREGNLDELIKYLKQNDLDWMYNHPFYVERGEHLNWRVIPGIAKNYFPVIELNSTFSRGMNDISLRLAENLKKGIISSSDSHTGNPAIGFVLAEGKNFKDFWENVKEGKSYIVRKDMNTWDIVKEASVMLNQTFAANTRSRIEKRYEPSTNFKPFNTIAKSVTSGSLKNQVITKKIIKMVLQSVNYTAGPILAWKLHVKNDEKESEYIQKKIHYITNNIKKFEENIKNRREIKNNHRMLEKDVQIARINHSKNYRQKNRD